jgi:hypothetical protein
MKVIISGTDGWAMARAQRELTAAGHEVLTCHEDGAPAFPCVGLRGAPCPVEQDVDVVLTVRAHPLPHPARREIAVTCALHHGIPLVVAGQTALNPFEGFATVITDGVDEIVPACLLAAGLGSPGRHAPAPPRPARGAATEVHLDRPADAVRRPG